jgi:hypothetical protein
MSANIERKNWIALTSKLLELTQKDQIKWVLSDQGSLLDASSNVYETSHLGQGLRIYTKEQRNNFVDTETIVKLEFLDEYGRALYTAPSVEGLADLFDAVRVSTANITDFMQKLGVN